MDSKRDLLFRFESYDEEFGRFEILANVITNTNIFRTFLHFSPSSGGVF